MTKKLEMSLINESQYDISFVMVEEETIDNPKDATLKSSISRDEQTPTVLLAQSTMPVSFSFTPKSRGPYLFPVSIQTTSPFSLKLESLSYGKPLNLVGICIEPLSGAIGSKKSNEMDKNGIDFLRAWVSHPKRLLDEYPSKKEDRIVRFDTSIIDQSMLLLC